MATVYVHDSTLNYLVQHLFFMSIAPVLTGWKVKLHDGLDKNGAGEISGNGYVPGGYAIPLAGGGPPHYWATVAAGATSNLLGVGPVQASGGQILAPEWGLHADDGGGERFIYGTSFEDEFQAPKVLTIDDGASHVFNADTLKCQLGLNVNPIWLSKFLDHYFGNVAWNPAVLDGDFNPVRVVSLHTGIPTFGPFVSNELVGSGYARQSVSADAPISGRAKNSSAVRPAFAATADWLGATYYGLWDHLTETAEPDLIAWGPLSSPIKLLQGRSHVFDAGTLFLNAQKAA